jgi:hypothetical protein
MGLNGLLLGWLYLFLIPYIFFYFSLTLANVYILGGRSYELLTALMPLVVHMQNMKCIRLKIILIFN